MQEGYNVQRLLFDHPTVTGDTVESRTLGTAAGTLYSKEFSYTDLLKNGSGTIGLAVDVAGLSSDTLTVIQAEFDYGGTMGYIKTLSLATTKTADFSDFYRIDTQDSFYTYLPFKKMRIAFTKTGTSDTLTIKGTINSSRFTNI